MFKRIGLIAAFTLAGMAGLADEGMAQGSQSAAAHLANILAAHEDTPGGAGLIDVAALDAATASEHAQLAGGDPTNIDPMIRHARHVLHALDPGEFAQGPGSGFGLRPAVEGMREELALAMGASDASGNVRTASQEAGEVLAAINASIDEAVTEARGVIGAPEYMAASSRVERLQEICADLLTRLEDVRARLAPLAA